MRHWPALASGASRLLAPCLAPLRTSLRPLKAASLPRTREPQPVTTTLRFSATGDNLIHAPIYKQAARRAAEGQRYNFDYCYEHLLDFYAAQDVNWINQETLCSKELEPSTYPCFSTPGECAEALYRAGIRVFSLSNNHTYDKGCQRYRSNAAVLGRDAGRCGHDRPVVRRERLWYCPPADGERCDDCLPLLHRPHQWHPAEQRNDGQCYLHQPAGCDGTAGAQGA